MIKIEIPLKLPSLNDYVNACRTKAILGANMKKRVEKDIMWFLKPLPVFDKPIRINFTWIEADRRRDPDNISFSRKFIMDSLVSLGKIKDDGFKYVKGFRDDFEISTGYKVILEIEEVK